MYVEKHVMSYNRIKPHPISGSLGAEIHGANLAELDDETFAEIKQALLEYLVIFFRDQDITPDQQIAFGKRFGELHIHPFIPSVPGHDEIIQLWAKSGDEDNLRLANAWHPDLSYTNDPPLAAILRAIQVPSRGGDTMWVNLYKAYDTLSDRMKEIIGDMKAVHDVTKTYRTAGITVRRRRREILEHFPKSAARRTTIGQSPSGDW